MNNADLPSGLQESLKLALESRQNFDRADSEQKRQAAHRLFYAAASVLHDLVGPDALETVHGGPAGDQASGLALLAHRAWLAAQVLPGSTADPYSLYSASNELRAMAHGDAPSVLRKLPGGTKGEPTNAYRLASHQLAARCWEKYLRGCGNSPAVSQNTVAVAYGITWNAAVKWLAPIRKALGEDYMNTELELASSGRSVHIGCIGYFAKNSEVVMDALNRAGRAYQDELRRRQN